jgi:catechol 2,3-dioxygenase-like lactoylglutathione lyase family enzyme
MLKRIKFASVPVVDQERALDFYTKKLGLKIFTDQSMGDSRWIELQVPGAETLLVLFKQADLQPGPVPAVVFCRQREIDLRGAQGRRRRVHAAAEEGVLGRARDLQGQRRKPRPHRDRVGSCP